MTHLLGLGSVGGSGDVEESLCVKERGEEREREREREREI